MATLIKTIKCPICGKGSALPSASFKKTMVENLGEVVVQECRGRHGFKKIKSSPLIDEINDPRMKQLLDELGDSASCVLVTIVEQNLPLDTRGFIDMYRKLEEKYRDTVGTMEVEGDVVSAEADDLERKIHSLNESLTSAMSELDELRSKSDDDDKKIKSLTEQISLYKEKLQLAYGELDELRSASDDFNRSREKWVSEKEGYLERVRSLSEELDSLRSSYDDFNNKENGYKKRIRYLEESVRIKDEQLQRYDVDALNWDK